MFVDRAAGEVGEEGFDEAADVGVAGDGFGEGAALALDEGAAFFLAGGGDGAEVGEEAEGVGDAVGGGAAAEGIEVRGGEGVAGVFDEAAGIFGGEVVAQGGEQGVEDGDVEAGEVFAGAAGEGEEGVGLADAGEESGGCDEAFGFEGGEVSADGVVGEFELGGDVVDGGGACAEAGEDFAAGGAEELSEVSGHGASWGCAGPFLYPFPRLLKVKVFLDLFRRRMRMEDRTVFLFSRRRCIMTTVGVSMSDAESRAHAGPAYVAYRILQLGFVVAPILAGADKFTDKLVNWDQYAAPQLRNALGTNTHTFMLVVGVIEIVAGIGTALKPKIFGYVVAAWLLGIIVNLLLNGTYFDIALRDLGLLLGALALAQLALLFDGPRARV